MGIQVDLEPGAIGQFDVVADGKVVASRENSLWKRFLDGGWPDPETVIEVLRRQLDAT